MVKYTINTKNVRRAKQQENCNFILDFLLQLLYNIRVTN